MDKYLLEILKEINTIIMPDLGALTITDSSTGEIMFMPYLKFDDGKLIQYIAEKEGLDENDAKNLVAKYVREIKQLLDQGETYDMYQFGTFSKNDEGEITFVPAVKLTDAKSPEVKEEQQEATSVDKTESLEPSSANAQEEKPVTSSVNPPESEQKEVPKVVTPSTANAKAEEKKAKEAKLKAEKEIKDAKLKAEKEAKAVTLKAEKAAKELKAKELRAAKAQAKKERSGQPRKKKGVFFWISVILGPILILAIVAVFLFREQLSHYLPFLKDGAKKTEIVKDEPEDNLDTATNDDEADETLVDEVAVEDQIQEDTSSDINNEATTQEAINTPQETSTSMSTGNYMIIAGTFTEAANAEKYLATVKSQGASSASILQNDARSTVILGRYNTLDEANQKLKEYQSFAPKAWITK